jgi:hypothetical protein
MVEQQDRSRDLRSLVVRRLGSLVATDDPWEPFRLLDPSGDPVTAATAYLGELQAAGRSTATQRSYGMALLRWFRFLWAAEVPWREATRVEARDFSLWIQITASRIVPLALTDQPCGEAGRTRDRSASWCDLRADHHRALRDGAAQPRLSPGGGTGR